MDNTHDQELITTARVARKNAFAPYSDFPVGAALLTDDGIYTGVNVEVSGRSTSIHAEMLAAFKAVEAEAGAFYALAVSTPSQDADTAPCGLCQHTLAQFCEDLRILEDNGEAEPGVFSLKELIGPAYSPSTRHASSVNHNS